MSLINQVSTNYINELDNYNHNYRIKIIISLPQENSIILTEETIKNCSLEDGIGEDNKFTVIGSTVINKLMFTIDNSSGQYSNYSFEGCSLEYQVGLDYSSGGIINTEYVCRGHFIVENVIVHTSTIEIICLDYMSKLDKKVDDSLISFPSTVSTLIAIAVQECSVPIHTNSIPNTQLSRTISYISNISSMTYRQLLSYIAQICGMYVHARAYEVGLEFRLPTSTSVWQIDDVASIIPGQDIIEITGVRCYIGIPSDEEGVEPSMVKYLHGTEEFCLDISGNPLIDSTNAQSIVDFVGGIVEGLAFTRIEAQCINNPLLEAGDRGTILYSVRNGNQYCPIIITRTVFSIGAHQAIICGTESKSENQANRVSEIELMINQEITKYDTELTQTVIFNKLTNNGSAQGLFIDDGQLYINMSYARTGILQLGGSNNELGIAQILDENDNVISQWDKNGLQATNANISGTISSGNGAIVIEDYYITMWYDSYNSQYGGIRLAYPEGTSTTYKDLLTWDMMSDRIYVNFAPNARAIVIGNSAIDVSIPSLSGYVRNQTAGDTVIGPLTLSTESGDKLTINSSGYSGKIGESVPQTDVNLGGMTWTDKNGNLIGYDRIRRGSTDTLYRRLSLRRPNASGTYIEHGFYMGINSSGNQTVVFINDASRDAFLTGLNLNELIKTKTYTYGYSLNAGATLNITGTNFGVSTPSGYTVLGIRRYSAGNWRIAVTGIATTATGSSALMVLANHTSGNASGLTATIEIIYIKTGFITVNATS